MPALQALMLDVDGVLVTGRPADGRPWATGLQADLGIDPGDLQRAFFAPFWEQIVTGRDLLRPRLEQALRRIAPTVPVERFTDYWFAMDSRLDPAVLAAVDTLRRSGLRVELATNQEHERARYLMAELDLADRVDGCHHSAALGCRKPERRFFDTVSARTGIAPSGLLLVDDSPANVEAARAAGWRGLHWTGASGLLDAVAGEQGSESGLTTLEAED